jgi:DnaJ-class molecular chaperone
MYRVIFMTFALLLATSASAEDCVTCHEKATPGAVTDWKLSRHFKEDVTCDDCHGDGHSSENDLEKVLTVTAETCADCFGLGGIEIHAHHPF